MSDTTEPQLKSFIDVNPTSDFPIQNLPYGAFEPNSGGPTHIGVAIGDLILDLSMIEKYGMFKNLNLPSPDIFSGPNLNIFMRMGRDIWKKVRGRISELLRHDNPELRDNSRLRDEAFHKMDQVEMQMPVHIGDYTDFYSSREHATNVGMMFRGKENALMPNWLHLPVAYNGRSSSVILSGKDLCRPKGQILPKDSDRPVYGPSRLLDFELEMGFFIGPGNQLGEQISIDSAMDHIFGMVLVNDWSARDIQKWEYQPLGPFLGKSFGTSISPWIVSMEALEPFRTAGPRQDPEPLEYLKMENNRAYDIQLEVDIRTGETKEPFTICRSNFKYMYWNILQQLAHHTVNGTNMRTGDLLASGTISGPEPGSFGSLLELTWRGSKPITLPDGSERRFIEDNDRITMKGWCQEENYRVGFGEVTGKILPANTENA